MRNLIISSSIAEKLTVRHSVSELEVMQAFRNHYGQSIEDTNEDHKTDPPSYWFVAETDKLRLLKVIFVLRDGNIHLKSAYTANQAAIEDYASQQTT